MCKGEKKEKKKKKKTKKTWILVEHASHSIYNPVSF